MSLDHFAGSGSTASDIITSDSPPSATPPATPSGPAPPSQVPAQSPPGLDLCIDLSSYSIPQQ
jgi:hypothetical protein